MPGVVVCVHPPAGLMGVVGLGMPGVVVRARLWRVYVSWPSTPCSGTVPLGPRKFQFCPAVDPRARKCHRETGWTLGAHRLLLAPSGELPSGRSLSPVALFVPAHRGSPTDPGRTFPLSQRAWGAPQAGETDPGTQAASGDQLDA